MITQEYVYEGPVKVFGTYLQDVYIGTTAVSREKAICNIRWKLARLFQSKYCVLNINKDLVKLKY